MAQTHLTRRQKVLRMLFMVVAVALVCWFFPHNEAFRYEYEVGKPWRYGRLSAPYDFPIYLSDSAIVQIEDSLHRQVSPRYLVNPSVAEEVVQSLHSSHLGLSPEAMQQLKAHLETLYSQGILSGEDRLELDQRAATEAILTSEDSSVSVPTSQLQSEAQAYESIRSDSLFAREFTALQLRPYLRSNLTPDTTAMRIEYLRLRQQVSVTSGTVLAESRIIDNGEIVTPHTYRVLESYRREQQERRNLSGDDTLMIIGRSLLVCLILCSVLLFFSLYRPWIHLNQTQVLVAIGAIVFMVILTSLANRFMVGAVYMVPIGIVTVLLSTFHGSRSAYYCHIIMVLLCSFIAPSHFEYLIIQCIIGMIIVFSLKDGLQERKLLMHVSLFCAAGYTGTYALYTLATEGSLANISWPILAMMLLNAILLLLSYLIIYAMENLFGLISDISLVELCNLGKGILLRLSQEAPGTFQHAMHVANISADAAKRIGANPSLVRVGALYHDIGKLWNPQLYTENQHGINPHNDLTLEQSVEIIKRHVYEGVELAKKEKLPHDIIDFILTHHGTSQVKYFYIKWCNEHPGEQPDEGFFSYPGPDPTTREQTILMMADSIEAATRSLSDYSPETITEKVNQIVNNMLASGHFRSSKLSFREVEDCKASFISSIESIHHVRIAYPELMKKS